MRPVPNRPLLWLALCMVVPATTMVVYSDGLAGQLGWGILIVFGAVSVFDLLRSRNHLEGVQCEVPELLRATKGREVSLPVSFVNLGDELPLFRYALESFPWMKLEGEPVRDLKPLPAAKKVQTEIPMMLLQRGQFFLESIHFETTSALSLWLWRRKVEIRTEVRVYPDLSFERKRLSSIFLMRGHEGSHLVRQVGKGRDFEQLREYQPGDDYTDIDWKATARRQMPVTKTYQIEKTQEVYVVVDHSRLSGREIRVPVDQAQEGDWLYRESSSGGEEMVTTQLEKFLHCSLILASVAERQGDLFGFVSFADKVDRLIRGRNGKQHYNLVRDALYTLEPKEVAPDFEQLMIALRQRLTRRALLVFLVDLSDPLTAEHFFEALPLINKQHLILVNMVRPEAAFPLFSGKEEPESAFEIYDRLGGHFQWHDLREVGNKLSHLGVELGIPEHAELCTETVTQYLNVKNRQLI